MLRGLASLLFQSSCPLCQRWTSDYICQYCQRQIEVCKLKNGCQLWRGDLPVFVWGSYKEQLKQTIAALKYNNNPQLGELMGYWLGKAWLDSPLHTKEKKITAVPIPIHRKKLQHRGFNQAELIARGFCQITGYSLQPKGLARVRETQAMFGLTNKQRKQNLESAFAVGKDFQRSLPRSPVLLIDDIYTTGATAAEATKILRSRKIQVLGIAVLSAAPGSLAQKNSSKHQRTGILKSIN